MIGIKADKEAREDTRARLLQKYPFIDLSRFKILNHIDNDAKAHPDVLFMDSSHGMNQEVDYDIEGDDKTRFWDNKQFTKYLYSNRPFPLIWSGGGSIQGLPKGRRSYEKWSPWVILNVLSD